MSRSDHTPDHQHHSEDTGGSFTVDGQTVEVDLAEFGWPAERTAQKAAVSAAAAENAGPDPDEGRIRLQKVLASAGIASRRACEALITGGRVEVNGRIERELGSRINPEVDQVRVDGVVVQLDVSKRYFVLNKPRGVVSTMQDETGKPDLREFTDTIEDRLYNVGRLDTDTSGLLILTNDGDLAHKLAHPSFGVQKTYIAKVRGRVTPAVIQQLRDGVELSDGPIHADRAKLLPGGSSSAHSLVELTLHSGRNRIVRRMLAEVGHPVVELVRRQFGPLHLGTSRVGELRELSAAERGALLSVVADAGVAAEGAAGAPDPRETRSRGEITGGRPGDGAGARGMRGIAAKGNPHQRRGAGGYGAGGSSNGDSRNGGSGRGGSDRGGYDRRDSGRGNSDRGGYDRRDSDRGGYQRGSSDRGGSERRDSPRGNSDRGWYERRDAERGGYHRGGADRGGYDRRDSGRGGSDRGGYDRRDADLGGSGRGHSDRSDRGGYSRGNDDRGYRGGRDSRGDRDNRDNRDNRDHRGDRDSRDNRDSRGDRDNRDNRGYGDNRGDRNNRDNRGGYSRGNGDRRDSGRGDSGWRRDAR